MKKINIREALLNMDRATDCEFDLTSLYEACDLDDKKKEKLVQYIDAYDIDATNKFLSNEASGQGLMEEVSDDLTEDEFKDIMGEAVVHMTDETTFNPLVRTQSLKVGDMVYDEDTGHKCKVLNIINDGKYSKQIALGDTVNQRTYTQISGNNALWEVAVEGDSTHQVDDDVDIELHSPTELLSEKAVNEELWDTYRANELVTYYLDGGDYATLELCYIIMNQMKEEGRKLPYNITDFFDAVYKAVDEYNKQFEDDSISESVSCNSFNKDMSRDDMLKAITTATSHRQLRGVYNKDKWDEYIYYCGANSIEELDTGEIKEFYDKIKDYLRKYEADMPFNLLDMFDLIDDDGNIKESLKESISWNSLNGAEQSAAEKAVQSIQYNGIEVEYAVQRACSEVAYGNVEPEYEDDDLYGEEANYDKVLDYVKSYLGINSKNESVVGDKCGTPTENTDDKPITAYKDELELFLRDKHFSFEFDVPRDDTLVIDIEGDWKHDHLYLDTLVRDFFADKGLTVISYSYVTEEDGSDYYRANHCYKFDKPAEYDALVLSLQESIGIGSLVTHVDDAEPTRGVVYKVKDGVATVCVGGNPDDIVEVPLDKLQLDEGFFGDLGKVAKAGAKAVGKKLGVDKVVKPVADKVTDKIKNSKTVQDVVKTAKGTETYMRYKDGKDYKSVLANIRMAKSPEEIEAVTQQVQDLQSSGKLHNNNQMTVLLKQLSDRKYQLGIKDEPVTPSRPAGGNTSDKLKDLWDKYKNDSSNQASQTSKVKPVRLKGAGNAQSSARNSQNGSVQSKLPPKKVTNVKTVNGQKVCGSCNTPITESMVGELRDIFCVDCDTVTSQTYKGSFKDGYQTLGRYICTRCGCENNDEVMTEAVQVPQEIVDTGFKKGDRVQLDTGETAMVIEDQSLEDDRVSVEIEGMGTKKYVFPETLTQLKESIVKRIVNTNCTNCGKEVDISVEFDGISYNQKPDIQVFRCPECGEVSDYTEKSKPITEENIVESYDNTVELEYKNLTVVRHTRPKSWNRWTDGDDWDEHETTMDWTLSVPEEDVITFIIEYCLEDDEFPGIDWGNMSDEELTKLIGDNFDELFNKYETRILDYWEDEAVEDATTAYVNDPDYYDGGYDWYEENVDVQDKDSIKESITSELIDEYAYEYGLTKKEAKAQISKIPAAERKKWLDLLKKGRQADGKASFNEDLRVYKESDLTDFVFWSGAKDTVKYLSDEQLRQIAATLEDAYPDGMTETEINDFFWFEDDTIAEWLGYDSFEALMEDSDLDESIEEAAVLDRPKKSVANVHTHKGSFSGIIDAHIDELNDMINSGAKPMEFVRKINGWIEDADLTKANLAYAQDALRKMMTMRSTMQVGQYIWNIRLKAEDPNLASIDSAPKKRTSK